jgi:hypothetical protein
MNTVQLKDEHEYQTFHQERTCRYCHKSFKKSDMYRRTKGTQTFYLCFKCMLEGSPVRVGKN